MWKEAKFWEEKEREIKPPKSLEKLVSDAYIITFNKNKATNQSIAYSKIATKDVDNVLNLVIKKSKSIHHDLSNIKIEWNVREGDKPDNLDEILESKGFEFIRTTVKAGIDIQTYDLNKLELQINKDLKIKILSLEEVLSDEVCDISLKIFQNFGTKERFRTWIKNRRKLVTDLGEETIYYGGYLDGKMVSFSSIWFKADLPGFVYLAGAGTDPDYEKQGIYSRMLYERIKDAKIRNLKVMYIDAIKNTSYPLIKKKDFVDVEEVKCFRLQGNQLIKYIDKLS